MSVGRQVRAGSFYRTDVCTSVHRRVRLITQNLLSCPSKQCSYPANFPLRFQQVETLEQVEAEFNEGFIRGFLRKIEWDALRQSAAEVSSIVYGRGADVSGQSVCTGRSSFFFGSCTRRVQWTCWTTDDADRVLLGDDLEWATQGSAHCHTTIASI